MLRRSFLKLAGGGAVAAALRFPRTGNGAAPAPGQGRPNILFALADDWSFGHAGAYGCKWVKTPAFDRVAREGLLFTRAYTPDGKCAPSRACIITGRNPWQLGAAANHVPFFPPEFKSVFEALGEHGYFAGMTLKGYAPGIAKDANGKTRQMTGQPFNKRTAPSPTPEISHNDYAANFADFLDAAPKHQPWSFWYGSVEPHRGYEFGSGVAKGGKKTSDIDRVPACWPDNETVRNDLLDYAFEVEHFDRHLGRMLAELEKRGLLENTLVVVSADNGMPFPHDKGNAYHDSDHLPLAMMWSRGIRKPGRTVEDHVSFIDFAPTFMELAGLPVPADMQGRSLVPLLKGERPADWRTSWYYRYYHDPGDHNTRAHYGVRTETHKLIYFWKIDQWEMYDLVKDPGEMHNLYQDPVQADTVTKLKAELYRLKRELKDDDQFATEQP